MAAEQSKAKIPVQTDLDPKELDKLTKSVLSVEQAPTSAAQTPGETQWQGLRDTLGPPFDSERVTLRQMRQLRKDPMISFALHYRKVPIAKAEWYIEARDKKGVNAQVAAFVDACLRKIYARYIFQRTLAMDFGFQAISKRWQFANPGGVYEDQTKIDATTGLPDIKPIWDQGTILPKIWRAPVALRPELVHPIFDDKTEDFAGILYDVPTTTAAAQKKRTGGKAKAQLEIDIYHALWATNQKDNEHGSIYGYPLTGYARDYWWAYKFLFGLSNRGYERLAIPPVLAYHPEGSTLVDSVSGATRPNWEIALEMAERLRANAVAAVPSTMAEAGIGDTSNTQRAWDFKFMETPTDALTVFDDRFNYLNVMKLRSCWVPELAFTGGEVGRTGGNVAAQMAEVFTQSQALLMEEIIEEVNLYMIPQLLLLNFPEFIKAGGSAKMVSKGFSSSDLELYQQVIQLLGQADPENLARIDVVEILKRLSIPVKDPRAFAAEREQIAKQAALGGPPLVPGVTTPAVANPGVNRGFTAGGSTPQTNATVAAGFEDIGGDYIYFQPPETIDLELADVDEFLSGLPSSKHYQDKTIRALSVQLRRVWAAHFRRLYPELANHVDKMDKFEFEDGDTILFYGAEGMEFADKRKLVPVTKRQAEKAARKIIESFGVSSTVLKDLTNKTTAIMRKMLKRASQLELQHIEADVKVEDDAYDNYIDEQVGRLIKLTDQSFAHEVRQHLVNEIREGATPGEIADGLTARFTNMPSTHADRIARSETRDAVNAATLLSSSAAGIRYVKATDGEEFDEECARRNNKLFTVREAWRELRKEHPNGTLGFDPVPRANFSIEYITEMPEGYEDHYAYFDDNTSTAFVLYGLEDDVVDNYLKALYDKIVVDSRNGHAVLT